MMGRAFLFAALLAFASSASQASSPEPAAPELTRELTGIIGTETYYGPPNYGEDPQSDLLETVYVLNLSSPTDINATTVDQMRVETFENVLKVQIYSNPDEVKLEPRIGKNVRVTGEIFHGFTGRDYSDLLMQVRSAEATN
ncbi:MAG: DUF4431 domain-containing protein [Pseudomonadota bacterium]